MRSRAMIVACTVGSLLMAGLGMTAAVAKADAWGYPAGLILGIIAILLAFIANQGLTVAELEAQYESRIAQLEEALAEKRDGETSTETHEGADEDSQL